MISSENPPENFLSCDPDSSGDPASSGSVLLSKTPTNKSLCLDLGRNILPFPREIDHAFADPSLVSNLCDFGKKFENPNLFVLIFASILKI